MEAETLVDVCQRLCEEGYAGQCRAEANGLKFLPDGKVFAASEVTVDQVIRLEGTSVASEQTLVFAVVSPDGALRATYCVCFGPDMAAPDAEMVQELDLRAADNAARSSSGDGVTTSP